MLRPWKRVRAVACTSIRWEKKCPVRKKKVLSRCAAQAEGAQWVGGMLKHSLENQVDRPLLDSSAHTWCRHLLLKENTDKLRRTNRMMRGLKTREELEAALQCLRESCTGGSKGRSYGEASIHWTQENAMRRWLSCPEVTRRSRNTFSEELLAAWSRYWWVCSMDPLRPHVTLRICEIIKMPEPWNQSTNAKESKVKRIHL